jgi:hypothetical protein
MKPLDKLTKAQWRLLLAVMFLIDSIICVALWWHFTGLLDGLILLVDRSR